MAKIVCATFVPLHKKMANKTTKLQVIPALPMRHKTFYKENVDNNVLGVLSALSTGSQIQRVYLTQVYCGRNIAADVSGRYCFD